MSAKMKTVFKGFDYMHCDDFAKYLGEMAAKGWHFKEWGAGLKFEQGEPEEAVYAVEVFTKASENDLRPEPDTQEFAEYCEAAGWEFLDAKQKFCIFKKKDADAVDLFTQEERIINVFKGMTSGSAILLVVLCGINALLQWGNLTTFFERTIFSTSALFAVLMWNLLFLGHAGKLGYVFWKKKQLMKKVQDGEDVYIGSRKDGKWHLSLKDVYAGILSVILLAYLFMLGKMELVIVNIICIMVMMIFSIVIAKVRPESNTNFMIQIIFSFVFVVILFVATDSIVMDRDNDALQKEKLPLQISDYREFSEEIEDVDIYEERNLFGSYTQYYIFAQEEFVNYSVYRTEHEWILDKIWEEELDARYHDGTVDCTADWGAEQALRNKLGTYYVRYENSILVFNEDKDMYLSMEQIEIICEKLDVK